MRQSFLGFTWRDTHVVEGGRLLELARRLEGETGWRQVGAFSGLALWMDPLQPLPTTDLMGGRGIVLGHLAPMPDTRDASEMLRGGLANQAPLELLHDLSRSYWGHYIALLADAKTGDLVVYRDPSGALECMTWDLGDGLHVVASDMARVPRWLRPRRQRLNWDRIGAYLIAPYAETSTPLFDDIAVVAPGEAMIIGGSKRRTASVWSPTAFAAPTRTELRDVQRELVRRVDECTAALVGRYDRVIVELSGGLDSSVLAAAIGATGHTGRVASWLNYYGNRAEGDESAFARDVTDRLGVELDCVSKPAAPLDAASLAELAQEFWPAIAGVDAARDRHEVELLRRTGAKAIVSGQGGDGIYFQYPTAMIMADEIQRRGLAALASPILADVARRTRQSVWSVLREVRLARRGNETRLKVWSDLIAPEWRDLARDAAHPWVRAARTAGLPPGKVLHVQGVATTLIYNGRSRRRRHADLLYPHFAQPVVELCLGVPVPDLAGRNYDRPFAREAFQARLPPSVLRRRSKGILTAHFAHMLTESMPFLRPYLLEGCLCEAGLLDREAVAAHLDPDRLILEGSAADILWAAVTEAWVRYWQTQAPDSEAAGRWAA